MYLLVIKNAHIFFEGYPNLHRTPDPHYKSTKSYLNCLPDGELGLVAVGEVLLQAHHNT